MQGHEQRRRLGRSELYVSAIGLGCWQFSEGQGLVGRFWPPLPSEQRDAVVEACLEGGVDWFDTAEAYGNGRSERGLSASLQAAGRRHGDVVVATKWWPILRTARSIGATIDERLQSLAPYSIDLHQIHNGRGSLSSHRRQMAAMLELVRAGKIRAIGVSNFSARAMRRCHAFVDRAGVPLASNQVRYSLLRRRPESDGTLRAARELGITVIAYSPLAQGILTGRFHERSEAVAERAGPWRYLPEFRARGLRKSAPVVAEVRRIAAARGVSPAQVALRWLVQFHGDTVVAIPGASRVEQARQNAAVLGFELGEEELRQLDEVSRPFL